MLQECFIQDMLDCFHTCITLLKQKKYQGSEEPKYITVFDSLSLTQDNFTNLMYEVQCMSDITILC